MMLEKLGYGIRGLVKRIQQARVCPSCGCELFDLVDRKAPYELLRCMGCFLQYRWPGESAGDMSAFYQSGYAQSGLTTHLPDAANLKALLDNGFSGSAKDFSRIVALLGSLGVEPGARILDYGANWGYGMWQLARAGYAVVGYEISRPRAQFGAKLGVTIHSEWTAVEAQEPFDVVFSSHVIEHTPDPARAIHAKMSVLSPGGLFVALFPNGSGEFKKAQPQAFHRLWGKVHPYMLDEKFIGKLLDDDNLAVGSYCPQFLQSLAGWRRGSRLCGSLSNGEMIVVCSRS